MIEDSLPIPEERKEDTVTFKRSHLYAALLPLAFVLGLAVGFLFWGQERAPSGGPPRAAANPAPESDAAENDAAENLSVQRFDVPVDDDPYIGPVDAPITIVEFSDYECPYCQKWHSEVFARLMKTYPKQVKLVYRDFPLTSIHANALPAAVAANCANEQGAFWEFHARLFGMTRGLGKTAYETYAEELGLDAQAFETCIEEGNYREEVEADFQFAANLGVRSTPTFFINGIPVVGAQPYEVFEEIIEKELAGEIP